MKADVADDFALDEKGHRCNHLGPAASKDLAGALGALGNRLRGDDDGLAVDDFAHRPTELLRGNLRLGGIEAGDSGGAPLVRADEPASVVQKLDQGSIEEQRFGNG